MGRTAGNAVVTLVAAATLSAPARTQGATDFASAWPGAVTRTWVGADYYADRLQDWRIARGRLECVEASRARPMRVVHLLTRWVRAGRGVLRMRVTTGPVEAGARTAATWDGFLVGAGGPGIDYRLTALCHHRPAPDGGLVVAVDGTGRVVFRDNRVRVATGGSAMTGPLRPGELAEIAATAREGRGFASRPLPAVELCLEAAPAGAAYRIRASAHDPATGAPISTAVLEGVAPSLVDGGLGLVSHLGPAGSRSGYWFRGWQASGSKLARDDGRAFGPVLCTQYSLSRGLLKLTAQMPPLGPTDSREAVLEVRDGEVWRRIAEAELVPDSFTFPFRAEGWDATRDVPYRVVYELRTGPGRRRTTTRGGTIRREPRGKAEVVVAAFTGHKSFTGGLAWNPRGIWFPHPDLVAAVRHHDPDLLFFSGDQVYEGDLTGAQRRPVAKALLDYLDKWYRWCWAFGDLTRDRPCVTIPDDHDVYHGNLWGAGGRHARRQDDGGYRMPARFVNMVQRTQTSHLPDPPDPTPVAQGIGVYYTSLDYAGLSFAILEDRKWKSSPTVLCKGGHCVNGWFRNPDYDPARQADVPGAVLLGKRQLAFLRDWATDWSGGAWMKVVLSQTMFANVATLPRTAASDGVVPGLRIFAPGEYAQDDRKAADADSNGWPQAGRNRALRALRRGFAFHIAGDQHLGSLVRYGVETWDDAGYAFSVPSIGNTFPRRWFPPEPGAGRAPGAPRYTGKFLDGFGNHVRVLAVSNPVRSGHEPARLHDRAPGYGILRFRKKTRQVVVECWPRWSDPSRAGAAQYPGWPVTVSQLEGYGRAPAAWLPVVEVHGMTDPVLRVIDPRRHEVVWALRIEGRTFRPWVFAAGRYTVEVGEPGTPRWKTFPNLPATRGDLPKLVVRF